MSMHSSAGLLTGHACSEISSSLSPIPFGIIADLSKGLVMNVKELAVDIDCPPLLVGSGKVV
jgi:hypothetical protein